MPWEQLKAIHDTSRRLKDQEARERPKACPIDGTPLEWRRGIGNCPMGNYRWPNMQEVSPR